MSIWETNRAGQLPVDSTDYFYRTLVPKDPKSNMEFRKTILQLCKDDAECRADIWKICRRDLLFYINTFGWTFNPRSKPPLIPMITYDYQDPALQLIRENLGVRDITVPKSRDMGASWCCILPMEHAFHFEDMLQFLLTSEKAELVDGKSHKALFNKLKFWWKHLPGFLRPDVDSTKMSAINKDNDSAFDGEATVSHLGTGDRRTAILLDEASKMANARAIRTATRDVSDCRIFNSTPLGREGVGKAFYEQTKNVHTLRIFMHWSEHPDKRHGLYRETEDGGREKLDEETYDWKEDYDFDALTFKAGRKPRSTWYDLQCERENNDPVSIAQELDIDFVGSAERLLSAETIAHVKRELIRDPMHTGIIMADPMDYSLTFVERRNGPVKLWVPLAKSNRLGAVTERPLEGHFAFGVDTSSGRATKESSESAIIGFNRANGEQVFEYCAHDIPPEQWAIIAVAVCKWFHDGFMVPENNGAVNLQFLDELVRAKYWNVYRTRYKMTGGLREEKERLGYRNNDAGHTILGRMCADILSGKCKLRSGKVLQQLMEYEIRGTGKLVHAGSAAGNAAGQGKLHGDAAIAAALSHEGVLQRPATEDAPEKKPVAEPGSMAWRMQQLDEMDRAAREGSLCVW